MTRKIKVKTLDAVCIQGDKWEFKEDIVYDEDEDRHIPSGKYYLNYLDENTYISLDVAKLEIMIDLLKERNTK